MVEPYNQLILNIKDFANQERVISLENEEILFKTEVNHY